MSIALRYPFTEAEANQASAAWGCNCGPTALAFALQISLDAVRPTIPDFEKKRYTSPTMMKAALEAWGRSFRDGRPAPSDLASMFPGGESPCLVRIQWTGKWTAAGSNPKWAYGYTHWITCWRDMQAMPQVFDVNGGSRPFASWQTEIVPLLATHKDGDGGWYPTHVWELGPSSEQLATPRAVTTAVVKNKDWRVGQGGLFAPAAKSGGRVV